MAGVFKRTASTVENIDAFLRARGVPERPSDERDRKRDIPPVRIWIISDVDYSRGDPSHEALPSMLHIFVERTSEPERSQNLLATAEQAIVILEQEQPDQVFVWSLETATFELCTSESMPTRLQSM